MGVFDRRGVVLGLGGFGSRILLVEVVEVEGVVESSVLLGMIRGLLQ